jgi:hypothetical protein
MDTFLQKWTPTEVLYLVGLCAVSLSVLALILAVYRYNARALADDMALKRERQQAELTLAKELVQRGLPAHDVAHYLELLSPPKPNAPAVRWPQATSNLSDEQVRARLATSLASLEDVPPQEIEQTMALVMGADRDRQNAALSVVEELGGSGASTAVVLATVRSLCSPSGPNGANASGMPSESPPLKRGRVSENG